MRVIFSGLGINVLYSFFLLFWVGCIILCLVAEKVFIENLSGSRFKPSLREREQNGDEEKN